MEYLQSDENTIGIDEVGRGTLFGDVVSAAIILPSKFPDEIYKQIKDSKKLSFKKREFLANYIKEHAITYGIGSASPEEIDEINILQATMKAMNRALNEAYKKKEFNKIIIDGNYFKGYSPPGYDTDLIDHECFINGDNIYLNIAAASIVAKNYHDNQILELLKSKPELNVYGLKTNMGYATKVHRNAIKLHGLTEYHRKSFRS